MLDQEIPNQSLPIGVARGLACLSSISVKLGYWDVLKQY